MKNIYGFNYNELFLLSIERPVVAQIEITKNCNQDCSFCFRHCDSKTKFIDKSVNDWQKAIDKLIALGIEEINFTGGEPFLFKEVSALFKYAKLKYIKNISVNTSGSINLTRDSLRNVDEIVFSIHGINDAHDKVTGISGSFKKAARNIRYAVKQGKEVGINIIVTSENIYLLDKIYNFFKNFNVSFYYFKLVVDNRNIRRHRVKMAKVIPLYLKFLKKIVDKGQIFKTKITIPTFIINKIFSTAKIPLPECAGGKYRLVIDYRGDVYPCRYFQTKNYFCGNIFIDDLKKVWLNGGGFKKFRKIILEKKYPKECSNCLRKNVCLGGCLAWRIYNNKLKQYGRDIRCKFRNAYFRS